MLYHRLKSRRVHSLEPPLQPGDPTKKQLYMDWIGPEHSTLIKEKQLPGNCFLICG